MKYSSSNIQAFFLLVRAGLFRCTEGADTLLRRDVDWDKVYQLAVEQCVVGLLTEGIEALRNEMPGKDFSRLLQQSRSLRLEAKTLYLEQRNVAMNQFVAKLINGMQRRDIRALLLKGQGVAQCYEKPLWRTCGDVDLLVWSKHYQKAKEQLLPFASCYGDEHAYKKHYAMVIGPWMLELHGSLRCGFSARVDRELDIICNEAFSDGNVTTWTVEGVEVPMLGQENNVLYVFVHFLNHFYKGGVGIRQVCDWCRLLWSYRDRLNLSALEMRLKKMGLLSEWRAFGAYAVEYLGMPVEAMPFYSDDVRWKRKARRIQRFILMTGNMGNNRKKPQGNVSIQARKLMAVLQRIGDLAHHLTIFPLDTLRFLPRIFLTGLQQK